MGRQEQPVGSRSKSCRAEERVDPPSSSRTSRALLIITTMHRRDESARVDCVSPHLTTPVSYPNRNPPIAATPARFATLRRTASARTLRIPSTTAQDDDDEQAAEVDRGPPGSPPPPEGAQLLSLFPPSPPWRSRPSSTWRGSRAVGPPAPEEEEPPPRLSVPRGSAPPTGRAADEEGEGEGEADGRGGVAGTRCHPPFEASLRRGISFVFVPPLLEPPACAFYQQLATKGEDSGSEDRRDFAGGGGGGSGRGDY
jgi:hypothetical protein